MSINLSSALFFLNRQETNYYKAKSWKHGTRLHSCSRTVNRTCWHERWCLDCITLLRAITIVLIAAYLIGGHIKNNPSEVPKTSWLGSKRQSVNKGCSGLATVDIHLLMVFWIGHPFPFTWVSGQITPKTGIPAKPSTLPWLLLIYCTTLRLNFQCFCVSWQAGLFEY